MDRRIFLELTGGSLAALTLGSWKTPEASATPTTQTKPIRDNREEITRQFILAAKRMGVPDNLGFRLTDPWQGKDGFTYLAYQRLFLQMDPDGHIQPWNTLDEMHQRYQLDRKLNNGSLGVTVPPKVDYKDRASRPDDIFEERINYFNIPYAIVNYAEQLKTTIDPGMPTSFEGDYQAYSVYRFQRMAIQRWREDGRIEHILIGDAAQRARLIPYQAQLAIPQLDEEVSDHLASCQLTGSRWVGEATYYSHAGCDGCSPGQIMSNGQPFRENALTIAFMRLPLNSWVQVTNRANKLSVKAQVTDRGGFEAYNLIADLSKGVRDAIGGTSRTPVEITLLSCPD